MRRLTCIALIILSFFATAAVASDQLAADLQKKLTASLNDHSAPGAAMLVASDKLGTLTFAAGESDIQNHTQMKVTDTFRLASMSKTFIAAAILKLADQGKLKITDQIASILGNTIDIKRVPNGDKLTIADLLQMRSGIPDYYQSDKYNAVFFDDENHIITASEAIATIYDEKPLFAPGKKYNYSNSNYVLLQLVIEQTTKQTLSAALNDLIISPLSLKHTYVTDEKYFADKDNHGLTTHGYTLNKKKQFEDVTRTYDGTGLGDGCMVSDLLDLQTFLKALLVNKTLISSDGLKKMLHLIDGYGLGISSEDTAAGLYYTHNGDASGYSGQYYLDASNTMVIILTNSDETKFLDSLSDGVYQEL